MTLHYKSNNTLIPLVLIYSISIAVSFAQEASKVVDITGGNYIEVNGTKIESPMNRTFGGNGRTTNFEIPHGISVTLAANENQQTLDQNSIHEIKIAVNKEEHTTTKGWVRHHKSPLLPSNYKYRAYGNKGTFTPVEHTTFTISVDDRGTTFDAEEGSIKIVRKIPVRINEGSNNQNIDHRKVMFATEVYELTAEGGSYTAPLNPATKEYRSYEEARNELIDDLSEPEDYVLYGELLLDEGREEEAIRYFNDALELYDPFFDDQLIAETYLNLGEAHYVIGNPDSVLNWTSKAIGLIEPDLQLNLEDLKFAQRMGDEALINEIKFDLFFNYDNLAWAYELQEKDALAEEYSREAAKFDWNY